MMMLVWHPGVARERDPTMPPAHILAAQQHQESVEEQTVAYLLPSIVISPTGRYALINSEYYQEGDKINGAEVIEIQQNTVYLNVHGRRLRLNLF